MDEDDDLDFSLPKGRFGARSSNLGKLFDMDDQYSVSGNTSLSYSAPSRKKQLQQQEAEGQKQSGMEMIHSCVAVIVLYKNETPTNLGNHLMSLVRLANDGPYRMLLINVGTKKPVAQFALPVTFRMQILPNNYAQFFDPQRNRFAAYFGKEQGDTNRANFISKLTQVQHAEAVRTGGLKDMIAADIRQGTDNPVKAEDMVNISYEIFLASSRYPKSLGSAVANVPKKKFKLGEEGKVILGLDRGVRGMRKGAGRLLIVPPSMAYGKQESAAIPRNSTLIINVTLNKCKHAKSLASPPPTPGKLSEVAAGESNFESQSEQKSEGQETLDGRTMVNEHSSGGRSRSESLKDRMKALAAAGGVRNPILLPGAPGGSTSNDGNHSSSDMQIQTTSSSTQMHHAASSSTANARSIQSQTNGQHPPGAGALPTSPSPNLGSYAPPPLASNPATPHGAAPNPPKPFDDNNFQDYSAPSAYRYQRQGMMTPVAGTEGRILHMNPYSMGQGKPAHQHHMGSHLGAMPYAPPSLFEMQYMIRSMQEKIDSLSKSLLSKSVEVESGSNVSQAAILSTIQQIADERKQLKQKDSEKQDKIRMLKSQISDLHEKNEKYMADISRLQEERFANMQKNTSNAHLQLLSLQEEKNRQMIEINEFKMQVAKLQHEIKMLEQEKLIAHQSLTTATEGKTEMEKLKLEAEKNAEEMKSKLEAALEAEANTQTELKKSWKSCESLQVELSTVQERMKQAEEKVGMVTRLTTENSSLRERVQFLESELEKNKHEVVELKGNGTSRESALVDAHSEREKLKETLSKIQKLAENRQKENEELNDALGTARTRIEELETQLAAKENSSATSRQKIINASKAKIDKLKAQMKVKLKSLNDEIERIKAEANEASVKAATSTDMKTIVKDFYKETSTLFAQEIGNRGCTMDEATFSAKQAVDVVKKALKRVATSRKKDKNVLVDDKKTTVTSKEEIKEEFQRDDAKQNIAEDPSKVSNFQENEENATESLTPEDAGKEFQENPAASNAEEEL